MFVTLHRKSFPLPLSHQLDMSKSFLISFAIALLALLAGCSGEKTIKITGEIADNRELTLRFVAYSTGGVTTEVLATPGGKFEFPLKVSSGSQPVFIEIYTNDYKPLGMAVAHGGDRLHLEINPEGLNGFSFSGPDSDDARAFADTLIPWLAKTKEFDNNTVAQFVKAHKDNPAAYAVLSMLFDASREPDKACQLFNQLTPEARPDYYAASFEALGGAAETPQKLEAVTLLCSADTLFEFNPTARRASFIAFTSSDNSGPADSMGDSIVAMLYDLGNRSAARRTRIIEHNISQDTVTWHRAIRGYLATLTVLANKDRDGVNVNNTTNGENSKRVEKISWTSVWSGPDVTAPGVETYNVRQTPYFIVADSTATIRYAGPDRHAALKTLDTLTK